MGPIPRSMLDVSHRRRPTAGRILAGYLLMAAVFVAFWVASYPLAAAGLLAGAVGAVAVTAALVEAVGRLRSETRRCLCVPRTGVCLGC